MKKQQNRPGFLGVASHSPLMYNMPSAIIDLKLGDRLKRPTGCGGWLSD